MTICQCWKRNIKYGDVQPSSRLVCVFVDEIMLWSWSSWTSLFTILKWKNENEFKPDHDFVFCCEQWKSLTTAIDQNDVFTWSNCKSLNSWTHQRLFVICKQYFLKFFYEQLMRHGTIFMNSTSWKKKMKMALKLNRKN